MLTNGLSTEPLVVAGPDFDFGRDNQIQIPDLDKTRITHGRYSPELHYTTTNRFRLLPDTRMEG